MKPRVLILHAPGTNRDREAALACELAGGAPEIVHLNQLLGGQKRLLDYGMLVLPGGFSYGDDLGAGTLWALALQMRLGEDLQRFVAGGRPVLGICNGFQALIKSGLLPGTDTHRRDAEDAEGKNQKEPSFSSALSASLRCNSGSRSATLTRNRRAHFECRWVHLQADPGACVFTAGLEELLYVPVAHGEGNFQLHDTATLARLRAAGQVALTYVDATGNEAGYPENPNGSMGSVAGVCNAAGNVLGLMPHPEDHVFPTQRPGWTRGEKGGLGLPLFVNGVRAAQG